VLIRKLNHATIATLDTPSVQQLLGVVAASVVAPERRSPEYLRDFVASEIERRAKSKNGPFRSRRVAR
jgi:hypothetical protein